jgi:hypothetical protein
MQDANAETRENAGTARSFRAVPAASAAGFALLAALFLARPASAAIAPLGLEASGAQIHAALHTDLDVRDAYNRPVSREVIQRQLNASATAADPSADVSRLPMAKVLWQSLGRVLFGFGLRSGLPAPFRPAAPRWAGSKRLAVRAAVTAVCAVVVVAQPICLRSLSAATAGPALKSVVLLC